MQLLEELKEYLRIDGDYEHSTINLFLNSAKQTLLNAGVKFPNDLYAVDENGIEKYSLHRLALINLASHYYENRTIVSQNSQNIVPHSIQTMILQLKWVKTDESSTV